MCVLQDRSKAFTIYSNLVQNRSILVQFFMGQSRVLNSRFGFNKGELKVQSNI